MRYDTELVSFKMSTEAHQLLDLLVKLSGLGLMQQQYKSRSAFILEAIREHSLKAVGELCSNDRPGAEFIRGMLADHKAAIERLEDGPA